MLKFSGVTKAFDGRAVLNGVTFTVSDGSRTAVVGVNGSGKSTLLRLAAGELQPDAGEVLRPELPAVAYVPQDFGFAADLDVAAYLKSRSGLLEIEAELHRLERQLTTDPSRAEQYSVVLERYAALGGYEHESSAARALDEVGLPATLFERPMNQLSGGQRVRVGLAGVLASRHSLYLLDEPTNNLDWRALEILEQFVVTAEATFLIVSHDRAFLNTVATDVVLIDEHTGAVETFGVTFSEYLSLRERAKAAASARYRDYAAEAARLKAAAAAQRATAGKQRDTRPARDNDKFARYFFIQRQSRQAGRAMKELERRLDRLEAVDEPRTPWELRMSLDAGSRSGSLVVEAVDIEKTFGAFRLGPLSLTITERDRLAVHGHNGAGKSVLVDLLTGASQPDSGTIRRGPSVRAGVLRQAGADTADRRTGVELFRAALGWGEADARTLLAKFSLGAGHVNRPVASYSPGERCRLGLAVLMAQQANWLILDEPTNHLDIEAQEELEEALAGFGGTLLIVSHDREFLDRVGVTRAVELTDGHAAGTELSG